MFYLIEITTYNDGTADSKGIYTYANYDLAVASFHKKMGGAMGNEKYQTELCIVLDNEGSVLRSEKWQRGVSDGV